LRVRTISEVFAGITSVKAYCWEKPFLDKIAMIRADERATLIRSQSMKGLNLALYFATPALSVLCTFSVYWARGNRLEISTVYGTMSLLHVLRQSLNPKS